MKNIPLPSKKRLISLSKLLSQIEKKKITSSELSSLTAWSQDTIRRDISLLSLHNGVSNGYDVKLLCDEIQKKLGINLEKTKKHRCCIVGLGGLGEALLKSSIFENSNFELIAGFDTNMNKIEIMKSSIPLYPTIDLEIKIPAFKIEYALLAVADEKAQNMASRLASYGIKGIINYTNTILSLPKEIKVENFNALLALNQMLAQSSAMNACFPPTESENLGQI